MKIGDTVMTSPGRFYILRSFFQSARVGDSATLSPLVSGPPKRIRSSAGVAGLTLVRTRELSLAFHYAAESERDGIEPWQKVRARQYAAHWLSRAEERNDDTRAALCLGSDRILDLEGVSP